MRIVVMRATIHLVTAEDCLALRPLAQPVLDAELARHPDHAPPSADVDLDAVLAAARPVLAERPRTRPRAARRARASCSRTTTPRRSRTPAAACSPWSRCRRGVCGAHGPGHHDDRRGVARPAARGRSLDRRGRAALSGGVRPGLRRRRRGVVPPDRFPRGHRPAAPSPAGAPRTSGGGSCSICPMRPGPIPRRRRRRGSCPSTTTCCSPTRTGRGSCRRATGAASPPRPGAWRGRSCSTERCSAPGGLTAARAPCWSCVTCAGSRRPSGPPWRRRASG